MGTSNRGCILRKVVSKEVTAGGRFDFFLDSDSHKRYSYKKSLYQTQKPSLEAISMEQSSATTVINTTYKFPRANLWRDLPLHTKKSQSVKHFKKHIKVWNFICNCRLCKSFVVNSGYI